MPEVSLDPKNQCTLDDPSDGADPPSAPPNAAKASGAPTADPEPLCLARDPEHEGSSAEATDELLRRFGNDAADPFAPTPLATPVAPKSCASEMVNVATSCGSLAYLALKQKELNVQQLTNCAGNLVALAICELGRR